MTLFKSDLKTLAKEIRLLKSQRKTSSCGYVHGLAHRQYTYRHMHIAYCLMRGKTMEQIENKVREYNSHNEKAVETFITKYTEVLNEALHISG